MSRNSAISKAKAQHYIPKFYLKGFTDTDGTLWVCERFRTMRSSKPKLEANRPDYYTHSEKGSRDETVENVLKVAESRAAPILRKLANPTYVLTPENAGELMVFVAFMFARVPSWREYLDNIAAEVARNIHLKSASDKEEFHKVCEHVEKSMGKSFGMDFEELRQSILKGDYEILQASVAFNLGAMLQSVRGILKALTEFGYQTLYAPDGHFFLTSDSPVFTIQRDGTGEATVGVGFGWPGVEVYFPVNKKTVLRMRRGIKPMGVPVNVRRVEQINNLIMATAARYLYSSQRYKRIARLFDERGCKVRPGKESFLTNPPDRTGILFK